LSGQESSVAIVTGGAKGIGAGVVGQLVNDGMRVVIADWDAAAARELGDRMNQAGGVTVAVEADVSQSASVKEVVACAAETFGAVHVLVNNAGILRDRLSRHMSDEEWDSVMDVHVRGSFLMARESQDLMREAGWGRIINLSSTSALGNIGQANYSAAKAGIQGLTKTLAIELGKYGITSNAVAPGFIATEMTKQVAERSNVEFDQLAERMAARVPTRRTGVPEDIAYAVSFLADPRAAFITGQVLYVDGGLTLPYFW